MDIYDEDKKKTILENPLKLSEIKDLIVSDGQKAKSKKNIKMVFEFKENNENQDIFKGDILDFKLNL